MEILISGASTGIGKAAAIHMALRGHSVWAGVRSQAAFDQIQKSHVENLKPIFLEVTSAESIQAALGRLKKEAGLLHGLVNNAGIAVGGPAEALPIAEWRRQFDTNFFGLIELTQACLPLLRQSKGRIVNVSSIAGRLAGPFMGPYSASKFAVEGFSDSLRRELQPFGVTVSIIEPGAIDTPIWGKSMSEGRNRKSQVNPEIFEVYEKRMNKFEKYIENSARRASPVALVVAAIENALVSRQPKTRYTVGRGIGTMSALAGVLPDRWMDGLLKRM